MQFTTVRRVVKRKPAIPTNAGGARDVPGGYSTGTIFDLMSRYRFSTGGI